VLPDKKPDNVSDNAWRVLKNLHDKGNVPSVDTSTGKSKGNATPGVKNNSSSNNSSSGNTRSSRGGSGNNKRSSSSSKNNSNNMPGLTPEAAAVASAPVDTIKADDPYYTLITSKKTVDPGVIDPTTGKRIGGTVEKAWENGGKQTIGVAKNIRNVGLVSSGAVLAAGFTAPVLLGGMAIGSGSAAGGGAAAASGGFGSAAAKFLIGTGASVLAPKIAEKATTEVTQFTNPNLYKEMKKPGYKQADMFAKKKISEDAGGTVSWGDDIVNMLPGVNQWVNNDAYNKYFREYYTGTLGYNPSQAGVIADAAASQNKIVGIWDAMGTIGIESGAEIMGGRLVTRFAGNQVLNAGTKAATASIVTKSAAKGLAIAGFYEGFFETMKSQLVHDDKITPFEVNNWNVPFTDWEVPVPGGLVMGGLYGAGTASLIGTGVARFKITRPKTGTGLLTAARIMDPFESFGDFFGGAFNKGRGLMVPTFNPSVSSSSQSQSKSGGKNKGGGKSPIQNPLEWMKNSGILSVSSPGATNTNTPSNSNATSPSESNNPDITPIPGPSVPTFTPINIINENPSETNTESPSESETETPSNNFSFTPVPTPTPFVRTAPPLLPFWGGGPSGGGGKAMVGSGQKYMNELQAAMKAFRRML